MSYGIIPLRKIDDEYMTPMYCLRDMLSYTKIGKEETLWEPFHGDGGSGAKMKKLGYKVIECKDQDFFTTPPPEDRSIIMVTNPPFSIKKEVLDHIINVQQWDRFAILIPAVTVHTRYFHKILEKRGDDMPVISLLFPHARIQFIKNGVKTRQNSTDTLWITAGIDLPFPRRGAHFMPVDGPRDA